jgi:hypothetical protein
VAVSAQQIGDLSGIENPRGLGRRRRDEKTSFSEDVGEDVSESADVGRRALRLAGHEAIRETLIAATSCPVITSALKTDELACAGCCG